VIERATLMEIQGGGEILVLLDGRKLRVSSDNLPQSSMWLPMMELEISDESIGILHPITVHNLELKETIRATWV
jgi:hypothetical protein